MPRDLPANLTKSLIKRNIGGVWLWLMEFAIAGQTTQHLARNTEDITYAGQKYDKFNFEMGAQVFSGDGTIPRVVLRVSNVNQAMEKIINETQGALGAAVKLIKVNSEFLSIAIPALEFDYDNLASQSNAEWATFTLGIPNPLTQRFPLRLYSCSMCPYATPSLFGGPECQYDGLDETCTGTLEDCRTKDNAEHWGGFIGLDPNCI